MLKEDFEYYLAHQDNFAREYEGKVLVIKNKEIIGVYKTEKEAVEKTQREHEIGTFLVQFCSSDPDSVRVRC